MAAASPPTFLRASDRSWSLASARPGADLLPYVRDYQGYEEYRTSHVRRRELPHGGVVLVINFGAKWRVADPRRPAQARSYHSFLAGMDDFASLVECEGRAFCLQVNFTPIGAYRFFGVPMHQLSRRVLGLDDLLGSEAETLADRLFRALDWQSRFEIAEDSIRTRLAHAVAEDRGVVWALQRIARTGGRCSIAGLARELDCSRKHLAARFHDQIGLTPKTFAGLLRFNRAVELIGKTAKPDLAQIAFAAGYFDQPHFNRDFLAFSGITPGDFVRARLADGDGLGG